MSAIVGRVKAISGRLAPAFLILGAAAIVIGPALASPLRRFLYVGALVVSAYGMHACASWAVRRHGGNNLASSLISALSFAYVACLAGPLLVGVPSGLKAGLAFIGAACFALVAAAWVAPQLAVKVTGGPSATWSMLRERARIYFENLEAPDVETDAERAAFEVRLSALDQYRNAQTDEFIDLFQEFYRTYNADLPADVAPAWMDRFRSLELRLFGTLGAQPDWYKDYPWLSDAATRQNRNRIVPADGSGSGELNDAR